MCRIHAALPSAKTSQRNNRFDFSSYASISHSAAFQLAKLACKAQLGTFVCLLEPLAPFRTMRIMGRVIRAWLLLSRSTAALPRP